MNKKVLEIQLKDLEIKKKKEIEIESEKLEKIKEKNLLYKEIVEKKVKVLEAKAKLFIDQTNLEYEIEKMLNSRDSYNFCIDGRGIKYVNFPKGVKLEKLEEESVTNS